MKIGYSDDSRERPAPFGEKQIDFKTEIKKTNHMKNFKCISLYQPWAQLVVMGKKKFETRSWKTHHTGLLLIHAGLNTSFVNDLLNNEQFKKHIPSANLLSTGRIIGAVDMHGCFPAHDILKILGEQNEREEIAFGNYERGRFAWKLKYALMFDKPIPFRGFQRLFDVPEELVADQLSNQLVAL